MPRDEYNTIHHNALPGGTIGGLRIRSVPQTKAALLVTEKQDLQGTTTALNSLMKIPRGNQ